MSMPRRRVRSSMLRSPALVLYLGLLAVTVGTRAMTLVSVTEHTELIEDTASTSSDNITTPLGPLLSKVTPVPNWPQVIGHRLLDLNSTKQFHDRRTSWPNKPHPDVDVHVTPSSTTSLTRTTGGGLLMHISLTPPMPPPPPRSVRGPTSHEQLQRLRSQISSYPGVQVDWVRPTSDLCPAEQDSRFRAPNGKPLHWPATKTGESALSREVCLDASMLSVRRPCLHDLTYGAQWADPDGVCHADASSEATEGLLNVARVLVTLENASKLTHQLAQALALAPTPRAGDVLLVANALARVSQVAQGLSSGSVRDLAQLLDGILRASDAPPQKESVDKDAEATRSILNSLDVILERMQLGDAVGGVASAHTPRAALLVADVARSGVRGVLAMPAGPGEQASFSDVQPLRGNETGGAGSTLALGGQRAEVAARLLGDLTSGRAAFVLIGTARTFPQQQETQVLLNSRVVGVTVTGGEGGSAGVELELRPLQVPGPGQARHCAYWDLAAGAWSTAGCTLVRHDAASGRDVCRCTHLTHFGEIIGVRGQSRVLDVISLAGCVLSLLGLLGIALTAAVFRQWRSGLGNKILLHLSFAIGLTMVSFLSIALGGATGGTGDASCIVLGLLMHYSVLAAFCWMLVSAALQLLRFVVVLSSRPPHFLLKGVLFGWGAPLVPVVSLLIAGPVTSYASVDRGDGSEAFCYPRGLALVLAVIVPVGVAVIANLTVFCVIVYRVSCGRNKRLHGLNVSAMSEKRMAIRQLRMSILLFFLLGLSWVFGLLALIAPNMYAWRTILSYLFCATATLQGFVLFLFFIVWERKARALWLATLPDTVRVRATTSDTTSGLSPSTGSSSGPVNVRNRDEVAPLRQRSTELELQRAPSNSNNGYHSPEPPTRL